MQSMRTTYPVVALVALAVHGLCAAASQAWVYPDSIDYIQLAGGIADGFDFTNGLYLVRTPGYPLFLAWIFMLFGAHSPIAIVLIQHAMMIATALLTCAISFRLTENPRVALAAGCLCACSLQLLAYANLILTEAPYTFILALAIYALVRFIDEQQWRWLALASLLAGVGYLLRPIALYLLPVCGALALRQVYMTRGEKWSWRPLFAGVFASGLPALLIAAPWMAISAYSHKSLQATRCLDYMYYLRAATFDGLDSTQSETMRDIHAVIAEAQSAGHLSPTADYRDRATVIKAYQAVRGLDFSGSSAILGRAGRDLMREHPWEIFTGTFRYAAWLLLSPDPVYRFQPGGAPGTNGKRDTNAEILDVGTYAFGPGSWEPTLREQAHYLPLSAESRPLTPAWTTVTVWFHRNIEKGRPVLGLADSLYEELMLIAAMGTLASLLLSVNRAAWWMIASVLGLHVLVSAFLSGPQTRYAAPIRPILCLYVPLVPLVSWRGSVWLGQFIEDWSRRFSLRPKSPAGVLMIVAGVALAVDTLSFAASHLWIVPTSIEYLELAKEVATTGRFDNELFLLRTPGYPVLLAALLRFFGSSNGTALQILQHLMTAATAVLTAAIAWRLTRRRTYTLVAGLFVACSLQAIAFANQVMTETPYLFALTACIYGLVTYHREGRLIALATASVMAGIAYLFRPIGLTVVCVIPLVVIHRVWSKSRIVSSLGELRNAIRPPPQYAFARSTMAPLMGGLLPMAACVAPWWIHNQTVLGANSFARCYDFALYNRAAFVERADPKTDQELIDIQRVVAQAKAEGKIDQDADEGLAWTVWQAYRAVDGTPLKESSDVLGHAAGKALWRDPVRIVLGTLKYSAWMLLTPDSSYRYQPDGAAGVGGKRDPNAELFDSALYLDPLSVSLTKYANNMILNSHATKWTNLWSNINRGFYRHIERRPPVLGVGDSLYEEIIFFCLAAGVLSMLTRERASWMIPLAVLALQIVPSAFVAGIGPRYSVPIQPILNLFAAFGLVAGVSLLLRAFVRIAEFSAASVQIRPPVTITTPSV